MLLYTVVLPAAAGATHMTLRERRQQLRSWMSNVYSEGIRSAFYYRLLQNFLPSRHTLVGPFARSQKSCRELQRTRVSRSNRAAPGSCFLHGTPHHILQDAPLPASLILTLLCVDRCVEAVCILVERPRWLPGAAEISGGQQNVFYRLCCWQCEKNVTSSQGLRVGSLPPFIGPVFTFSNASSCRANYDEVKLLFVLVAV